MQVIQQCTLIGKAGSVHNNNAKLRTGSSTYPVNVANLPVCVPNIHVSVNNVHMYGCS